MPVFLTAGRRGLHCLTPREDSAVTLLYDVEVLCSMQPFPSEEEVSLPVLSLAETVPLQHAAFLLLEH